MASPAPASPVPPVPAPHGAAPGRSASSRATLMIVLSACGFAAIAIFVSLALATGASLLAVLTWRYIIASAILVALGVLARELRADAVSARAALLAGVGQSIVAMVSLSALRYIPAATLSFLFYTYPAWVAVIARVRHSEPLTPTRLVALGLSLAGIFVMVGAPGGIALHPVGVLLALAAALLYAAYIPMMAWLQRPHTPLAMSVYTSLGAMVVLGTVAATRGELLVAFHRTAWLAIIGLSVLSTVAAFLLFLSGLRALGSVRTAIISTVEPFFTALLGAWILAQPFTASTLLGGSFIAAAVLLLQLRPIEQARG